MHAVSESVVWCEFLRSEREKLVVPALVEESGPLTSTPKFESESENSRREELLRQVQSVILNAIPDDMGWWEVVIDSADRKNLFTPTFPVWIAASDGTCRLEAVAENLGSADWTTSDSVAAKINMNSLVLEMQLASLRAELASLKPVAPFHPIGVSLKGSDKITIIHGIKQLAALMIRADDEGEAFRVRGYFGNSEKMSSCSWLGH